MRSKYQAPLLLSTIFALATISGCGFDVKMGSETKVIRENKLGTAIAPMEDIKVKAMRLQDDRKTIKLVDVTIKRYTVIRVGIECVFKESAQILTQDDVTFSAMTPDKDGKLGVSTTIVPRLTGIQIGTEVWQPPEEKK